MGQWDDKIHQYSQEEGVPEDLVRAIMGQESAGNMTGVPQSDKDLIASGTNTESMTIAVREALDNAVANGNTALFASIANQPVARKGMLEWFNNNLEIDMKSPHAFLHHRIKFIAHP